MQLSESKEKELVEKVALRFVLSDTPEKYEQALNTFLPPLLLKLASCHNSVRQAVFEILKDVLSRLNTLTSVELPVENLLDQAKKNEGTEVTTSNYNNVRLYSLLFASRGIERISDYDRRKNLIPTIINGISTLPTMTSSRLFHILCKIILKLESPLKGSAEEDDMRQFYKPINNTDMEFVLSYCTKFFLLNPAKPDQNSGIIPRGYTCPGLTADDVSFFTYNAGITFTKDQMVTYKRSIFKFITHGFVPDDQQLIKFLSIVSTDSTDISDKAVQMLKTLEISYEDSDFINYLISLYIGDTKIGRPPVKQELQEKILTILNRSVIATEKVQQVSLICSIGLHSKSYKLRSLCLTFIGFVSKNNHQNLEISPVGSSGIQVSIASLIRNNLNTEGWPRLQLGANTPNFSNAILQRRLQYETLGLLLKKDYELVKDLSFIEFLFDSLKGDLNEFRPSIQETLNSLTPHLYDLPLTSKNKLKKLAENFLNDDYQFEIIKDNDERDALMACRYVCIKYINAAFDFNDCQARYFNILGTSRTNRFDIIEESYKGLNPYWFKVCKASNSKDFKKTSELLGNNNQILKFPELSSILKLLMSEVEKSKNNSFFVIRKTLNTSVRFIKQVIISNAIYGENTFLDQDEDWSIKITNATNVDHRIFTLVSNYIKAIDSDVFISFLNLIHNEFALKDSSNRKIFLSTYQDIEFGQTLLFFLQFCSSKTLAMLSHQMESLFKFINGIDIQNDKDLQIAANCIGIISVGNVTSPFIKEIFDTLLNINNIEKAADVIITVSYMIPRLYLSNTFGTVMNETHVKILLEYLIENIVNKDKKLDFIKLMGQLIRYGVISSLSTRAKETFIRNIITVVKDKIQRSESSIELLGYISLYTDEFNLSEELFDLIYSSHTTSQIEMLFTGGESLSILSDGWMSSFLEDNIDIPHCQINLPQLFPGSKQINVLNKVLEHCDNTKPSLRKAACIWLLTLVKYNRSNPIIKEKCEIIHMKFMRFLSDRDEIIQESASKGLSLVYELGNFDVKETMLKDLLRSFTDTAAGAKLNFGSVSEETELFDAGALSTGDDSIKTYKDVLSLASEVGDPSLVYKFMNLAKSSSLWSSRKGIAFGLGAIMSKASLENIILEDKNTANKLIPKLFRYRFDPYELVSNSMNDIWNTLISNSSEIINSYFDLILDELLVGMSNKEWRVREASSKALLHLIQTVPKERFADKMIDLWTMSFRSMDDIKESVRQEGTKLTNVLAKLLARSIDINNGVSKETSENTLKLILPFLLGTKGLNSDAEDVRSFALKVVIDLVKNTGYAMKPFAPNLAYEFTLLLSSMEPEVINYLALNAKNFKVDATEIDAQRSNVVASSPIFNIIEKLISMSDDTVIENYVNNSIKAVRKSIGLPSKIAASSVIILLVQKYQSDLKPYSGKLLKSCFNAVSDRNGTVNQSFANTFGYIVKISSIDKVIKYSNLLVEKYFSEHSPETKLVVGKAISSMIKYAPSQFESVAGIYIPLVFIASNDSDKESALIYGQIWTESSSLGSGTIKLYLDEIIKMLSENINSTDFSIRRTCAGSVSILSSKIDNTITKVQVSKLFDIILQALNGRSWSGKEAIVEALVELTLKFKDTFNENEELKLKTVKAFITEISKKNQEYVSKIIIPYTKFIDNYSTDELLSHLISVSTSLIENLDSIIVIDNKYDSNSSAKRIKTQSDITKKSTRENVEKEEFITELLLSSSNLCKFTNEGEYPYSLLLFIFNLVDLLFSNEKVIFTWRTNLVAAKIGCNILDNYQNKDSNPEMFEKQIENYWHKIYKMNSKNESIENVKLGLVQFAKLIITRLPSLKTVIERDLIDLTEDYLTPRVISEIKELNIATS
ncbi:hypothetical protein TPHA_0K02260 [Tetrapisispora phaffii CBS 4417]|uniref:Proteasome component ECM29 n=1 Tax=Tetrapisispora phaffii (strain ATCC 24235 / CBS 4417 / NBRC 1672 / NRRL Y-8282 / UCD 70-5) TaxID=1071381 RepID=G8BZM8_TETPH|nr:hypothetical protein TPHA_0K02260 [Tetrapisispora phaffii CBS 4417]CCE65356.1 hypothetical protein TPHA_0K02260 [Tetrapisispora phaffii CBS 4417]